MITELSRPGRASSQRQFGVDGFDPHAAEPPEGRLQGEPVGHALEDLTAGLGNGKAIAERTFRIEHRLFVDGRVGTSHLVEDVQKHRIAEKRHRLQFTLGDSPQVANAGGLPGRSICKSRDCVRLRPFTDDGSSCRWRCTAGPRCAAPAFAGQRWPRARADPPMSTQPTLRRRRTAVQHR